MFRRITFILVCGFWLTMSYLLWKSEYVGETRITINVPPALVWKKILTAPDTSSLEIRHHEIKVGYCRWASSVGQDIAKGKNPADEPTSIPQATVTSYRLDLEGNVTLPDIPGRLRFDGSLKLSTNNMWEEFRIRLNLRPSIWEVSSVANQQLVRFVMDDRDGRFERVLRFSDLQNPQTLMDEFNLPPILGVLGAFGALQNKGGKGGGVSLGLDWKASNDWVMIGHTSVKAYRLEASVLERYRMRVLVSRVGEILKVELPDEWELVNDQLVSL
jgi:hypothetical protein